MTAKILAFGVVREIFNSSSIEVELKEQTDIIGLRLLLENQYPGLKGLASFMIAINKEYAAETDFVNDGDEVAIIPPVSGG